MKEVIRHATEADIQKYQDNLKDADDALALCKELVATHELNMRLVNCEYTLDKSKVIFNFTADDRIDFRTLVKSLAYELKHELSYDKLV